MPTSLTSLHTAAALARSFDALITEIAPDVPVRHLVAGDLRDTAHAEEADSRETRAQVRAVAAGGRILVVATLESSLAPATNLIRDVASKADRKVAVATLLAEAAYYAEVADAVRQGAPEADS